MKKNTKKIAVFDPYLDILGGGEKYILSIAKVFDEKGFQIDLIFDDQMIKNRIGNRLGFSYSNLQVIPSFLFKKGFFGKLLETKKYHFLFYITDGSYFFSSAKNNFIYAMVPKKKLYQIDFLNRAKLSNFEFLTHSKFTKKFVDRWIGKESIMLYPYLSNDFISQKEEGGKEKIILTVGRFFEHLHSKRQDLLISSFKELQQEDKLFKDFKLYLIGGLKDEDKGYFGRLKLLAEDNKNIIFLPNASYNLLLKYYKKAMFYWHAAGYGIDEEKNPHLVEHLGIAPLEAMASGCVVFCLNLGGPAELIKQGKTGFLYQRQSELIEKTIEVYKKKKTSKIAKKAQQYIKENFSYKVFKRNVINTFNL